MMTACSHHVRSISAGGTPLRQSRASSASRTYTDMNGLDSQTALSPSTLAAALLSSEPTSTRPSHQRWASSPPLSPASVKMVSSASKEFSPVPLSQPNITRRTLSKSPPGSRGSRPSSIDTSFSRLSTSPSDRNSFLVGKRPSYHQPHSTANPHTRGFSAPPTTNISGSSSVSGGTPRASSCSVTPPCTISPRSPKEVNGAELFQVLVHVVNSMSSGLGVLASQLSIDQQSDAGEGTMKRALSSPALPLIVRSRSPSVGSVSSSRSSSPVGRVICRRVESDACDEPPGAVGVVPNCTTAVPSVSEVTLEQPVVELKGFSVEEVLLDDSDITTVEEYQIEEVEEIEECTVYETTSLEESTPDLTCEDSPPCLHMDDAPRSPDSIGTPRSILKRSPSSTSTATTPKSIHFGVKMEHICIFGFHDQPVEIQHSPRSTLADVGDLDAASASAMWAALIPPPFEQIVAAGSWHILNKNLPPFVSFAQNENVRLESIRLATVTSPQIELPRPVLVGNVIVRNVDFEKRVFARYSVDDWGSYTEANGLYASSVHGGIDRFTFTLDLAQMFAETEERLMKRKVVKLALRFEAQGREYWDNCCGNNYEVELTFSPPKGIVLGVKRGVVLPEGFELPEGTGPEGIIFEDLPRKGTDEDARKATFVGPLVVDEPSVNDTERYGDDDEGDKIPIRLSGLSSWGGTLPPASVMTGGRRSVSLSRGGSSLTTRMEECESPTKSDDETASTITDATAVLIPTEVEPVSTSASEALPELPLGSESSTSNAQSLPERSDSPPVSETTPTVQRSSYFAPPPPAHVAPGRYYHSHPSWFPSDGYGYYGFSGSSSSSISGASSPPASPLAVAAGVTLPSSMEIEMPMSSASTYGGYYYGSSHGMHFESASQTSPPVTHMRKAVRN